MDQSVDAGIGKEDGGNFAKVSCVAWRSAFRKHWVTSAGSCELIIDCFVGDISQTRLLVSKTQTQTVMVRSRFLLPVVWRFQVVLHSRQTQCSGYLPEYHWYPVLQSVVAR